MNASNRTRPPLGLTLSLLCAALVAGCQGEEPWPREQSTTSSADLALESGPLPPLPARRTPLNTGIMTPAGQSVGVRCGTCHASQDPSLYGFDPAQGAFHQGLTVAHGELPCSACHQAPLYDDLHLADGTLVPLAEAETLCAQCHGPQARDYRNGSHGGMIGHWDESRGPRQRNTCTACHDPHAPAYVGMTAAPRAFDRFLAPPHEQHEEAPE